MPNSYWVGVAVIDNQRLLLGMEILKVPSVNLFSSTYRLPCSHHVVTSFWPIGPLKDVPKVARSQSQVSHSVESSLHSLVDVFPVPKNKVVRAGSTILLVGPEM